MSAVVITPVPAAALPLLCGAPARVVAWRRGVAVTARDFERHVRALARRLPHAGAAVNLCEDRYHFLVAFHAIALAGQTNLLPASRAPQPVAEALAAFPGAYALSDCAAPDRDPSWVRFPCLDGLDGDDDDGVLLPADQVVAIGYTSGSTGQPKPNPKTWGGFAASSARNAALLHGLCGAGPLHLVATVPPQHMYGLETSILLPLYGAIAVHDARPLFPADVAAALAQLPAPRVLVTTPVHLRALVADRVELGPLALILSATAPLDPDLARTAEQRFATRVEEVFGSTETCVIAHRRTADGPEWTLYDDVQLKPQPDGTLVAAPWLAAPTLLQDIVELIEPRRFRLCGRHADLLEIAGKRASLGDLTRKLLALPGVHDGVVFQLDADQGGVRRLAALVVAPGCCSVQLLEELRAAIDPAFLPRPLKCVDALPRNETGKLPRAALLAALRD